MSAFDFQKIVKEPIKSHVCIKRATQYITLKSELDGKQFFTLL